MKLLTVDIWDTVLRRVCQPDDIKRATARYLFIRAGDRLKKDVQDPRKLFSMRVSSEQEIGERSKQNGYDDEYEIHQVFQEWVRAALGQSDESLVQELYSYELEQEKKCSCIDPGIVEEIQSCTYDRLCYVSDFYAEFIDEILEYHHFPLKFDEGYISCTFQINKRSGRLFDMVRARELPDEWTHIGDNPYSDIRMAHRKGIKAKQYDPPRPVEKTLQQILSELFDSGREETLGIQLGSFFYTFIANIIEQCARSGVSRIYYFTREGEFFKQIHDAICSNNPYGIQLPQAEILEVSRRSTFAASLPGADLNCMMRLWNQYSIQSMSAMFKSLDMDVNEFIPFLEKYRISVSDEIVYPWQDERVKSLFSDHEFAERFQKLVEEKRTLLKAYLTSRKMDELSHFAIVDIGWRGTIQDNLCILLPDKQIDGYYVALLPFLNPQPTNSDKYSFLNASPLYPKLMQCVTPFEMICNSPKGSTQSYKLSDGIIRAQRKSEERENRVFFTFTQHFQDGVLRAIPEICRYCETHAVYSGDLYEQSVKDLYEFFNDPDQTAVDAFFQLQHNEEFGVGRFVDKRTRFRPFLFVTALISRKKRVELVGFLNETTWVQGYLKKYHLLPLVRIYRMVKRGDSRSKA